MLRQAQLNEWLMHNDEWISTAVHNGNNGSHVFDPLISDLLDEMGDVICDSPLFKAKMADIIREEAHFLLLRIASPQLLDTLQL